MKERLEKLQEQIDDVFRDQGTYLRTAQGEAILELYNVVAELAHKVEQFEPEEITEVEIRENVEAQALLKSWDEEDGKRKERDKLALELVNAVLDDPFVGQSVLHKAAVLKEKYLATKVQRI